MSNLNLTHKKTTYTQQQQHTFIKKLSFYCIQICFERCETILETNYYAFVNKTI